MTTAIDTNVIVSFWSGEPKARVSAREALRQASQAGALVLSPPVFSELIAAPGVTEEFLNEFIGEAGIAVEWSLTEEVWREAGRAYRAYAGRRAGSHSPRRILADFVIGAHAAVNGYALLTLDRSLYRSAFPHLQLITF